MPLPPWLRQVHAHREPTLRERVAILERNQETMMDDLADLQANETQLEGAVSDAIDDIHALNAQLQAAVAGNNTEGVKSIAAAMAATTARLREVLPTKANPAPAADPAADPAAAQAAQDAANLNATNDTVGGQGAEGDGPQLVADKTTSPGVAANMLTTGSDPATAAVQMNADLAANASTANGLSVAMQHPQASAAETEAATAQDADVKAGAIADAPSLAETLPAQDGVGETTREATPASGGAPMVNGAPADPEDPTAAGPAAPEPVAAVDQGTGIDPNAPSPNNAAPGVDGTTGTAHEGTDTASADAVAQQQAQQDAGSVAGVGGPAPTPESLGQVTEEGEQAKGTTKAPDDPATGGTTNGEPNPPAPPAPANE